MVARRICLTLCVLAVAFSADGQRFQPRNVNFPPNQQPGPNPNERPFLEAPGGGFDRDDQVGPQDQPLADFIASTAPRLPPNSGMGPDGRSPMQQQQMAIQQQRDQRDQMLQQRDLAQQRDQELAQQQLAAQQQREQELSARQQIAQQHVAHQQQLAQQKQHIQQQQQIIHKQQHQLALGQQQQGQQQGQSVRSADGRQTVTRVAAPQQQTTFAATPSHVTVQLQYPVPMVISPGVAVHTTTTEIKPVTTVVQQGDSDDRFSGAQGQNMTMAGQPPMFGRNMGPLTQSQAIVVGKKKKKSKAKAKANQPKDDEKEDAESQEAAAEKSEAVDSSEDAMDGSSSGHNKRDCLTGNCATDQQPKGKHICRGKDCQTRVIQSLAKERRHVSSAPHPSQSANHTTTSTTTVTVIAEKHSSDHSSTDIVCQLNNIPKVSECIKSHTWKEIVKQPISCGAKKRQWQCYCGFFEED